MLERLKNYKLMENKINYLFNVTILVAFVVQLIVVISLNLGVPSRYFANTSVEAAADESVLLAAMIVLLLAPILETLIFQFAIYYVLRFICKLIFGNTDKALYIIPSILTALIFISQHWFSIVYMILVAPISFIFQYTFVKTLQETNSNIKAILMTATQHFLYNLSTQLITMLIVVILKLFNIEITI